MKKIFRPFVHHYFKLAVTLLVGACLSNGVNSAETLRMVAGEDGVSAYAKGVLKLVLSKLPETYSWDESTPTSTEQRITQMLAEEKLDIVWYATTNDFEELMRPIRIPLYKGLLGYRLFMIKQGNQHLFNGIENLTELKQLSIGQGHLWADTDILRANGLNVIEAMKYESLFHMLDGDRFDAFPRGVNEPWYEMPRYPELALTVEQNLMLSYTNPFYFFVNKNNTALAEKIEYAFRAAIEDGSFDEYFFNDPTVTNVIRNANLASRKVIKLRNPLLPPKTPLNDTTLWFDPSNL